MQSITIKGTKRESVGKVATKALRNADKVPCVIYGKDTIHFSAEEKAFKNLVYTPSVYTAVIELESGEKFETILQDIQFHPVTDKILHIDFYELSADKPVTMHIPVRLEGNSKGVKDGGQLLFTNRKLNIRALPGNLPDEIVVDITDLAIGDKFFLNELADGDYEFLHPESMVVVQVKTMRAAIVEEVEETEGEEGATEEGAAETTEGSEDSKE